MASAAHRQPLQPGERSGDQPIRQGRAQAEPHLGLSGQPIQDLQYTWCARGWRLSQRI